jgi:hypothetical protein
MLYYECKNDLAWFWERGLGFLKKDLVPLEKPKKDAIL